MKTLFDLHPKLFIGVVHLKPLPGAPAWHGDMDRVLNHAMADAVALDRGGAHALFIENFGDVPFTRGPVGPETVAAMCAVARALREQVKLPIGFNVLRNDAQAALALCAACGGSFIRVNVHTGALVTDQGLIEGNAHATVRYRRQIAPLAQIFADVHVKHAALLGNPDIETSARDTLERGLADGLIVSGIATGQAADLGDLERVRRAVPRARILVGSGVGKDNVKEYLRYADGVIAGTSLKFGGRVGNPVDARRVAALAKLIGH
jgi:membrane complex biogenesis BtpA family protein